MADYKIVGKNIRNRRVEIGMTLEELAKLTGYADRTGVYKIESGKNNLNHEKLLLFANALQTTPAKLLGVKENPITIDRLLSLGFDKEKMEKLTLNDIEEIRSHILTILDRKK